MSDFRSETKDEVEGATPDDGDIAADVPRDPGTTSGDLNAAGSEPGDGASSAAASCNKCVGPAGDPSGPARGANRPE